MEEEDNSMEAILWVFLIAILIMSIAYYINYFMYNKQYILIPNKNGEQDVEQHTQSTYQQGYPNITNENKKIIHHHQNLSIYIMKIIRKWLIKMI